MEEKLIVKGVVKFMGVELPEIFGGFGEGKKVLQINIYQKFII